MKRAEPLVEAQELHHGSHNGLLTDVTLGDRPAVPLDAIIVPTAWPVDALRHVMGVGTAVGCPVVVLCSKQATAEQAVKLADDLGAAVLAVDVDDSLTAALAGFPSFATDRLLHRSGFGSGSDLSLKRNFGLTLARGSGWHRVLFLDDDILVDEPAQLEQAAGLLDRYRAVGLANGGFADNSVVCHAYRAVGGRQGTFIGGGAMMVDAGRTTSFFPNIYNEDWFFLLGDGVPFRVARAGRMRQRPYDPFANPNRAAAEELGDTLAESLFSLLDFGHDIDTAVNGYWADALHRRRRFIDLILAKADRTRAPDRIRRSLRAAGGRSADIRHSLCNAFLDGWREDLRKWRTFLDGVPVSSGPEKFASETGLTGHLHRSGRWAEHREQRPGRPTGR